MKHMTAAEFDADSAAAREAARRERLVIESASDPSELQQLEPPNSPKTQEELEAMLLEGLKGPFVPLTDELLDGIRQRVLARRR